MMYSSKDIEKAVNVAVSSALAKFQKEASSGEDFINPVPKRKKKSPHRRRSAPERRSALELNSGSEPEEETSASRKTNNRFLPTAFLSKRDRRSRSYSNKPKEKIFHYDRDILCLPMDYGKETKGGIIKIPRGTAIRDYLGRNGLIGKIRLSSNMSEKEIFKEICSVFEKPMNKNPDFLFSVLQLTGGASKSLTVPSVSASFRWTASAVAGKNAKVPIYIIAREELICDDASDYGSDAEGASKPADPKGDGSVAEGTSKLANPKGDFSSGGSRNKRDDKEVVVIPDESPLYSNDYIDLLSDDSSHGSPTPPVASPLSQDTNEFVISPQTLLQVHRLSALPPDTVENIVRIKIRRRHVLEDTLHKLRNGLDVTRRLHVVFIAESAVDAGGPMREFMHLLIAAIGRKNSLFCGNDRSRVPMHSVMELEKETFVHIGRLFALSFLYGGPGPKFLAPAVADYIVYGIMKVKATTDDVPDEAVRKKLERLQMAKSVEGLRSLLASEEYDFRFDLGIGQPVTSIRLEDVQQMVCVMAKHYAILSVKAELDQILCGMATTFNFLDLVRENPKSMRPLFIYTDPPPLTSDTLYDLLRVKFSPEGNNKRELEEEIIIQWNDLTQYVDESHGNVEASSTDGEVMKCRITLADILVFITGAPAEPPIGFLPQPSIQFHYSSKFPTANTCTNTLYIPYQKMSFDEFKYNVFFGIKNSFGYGQV